MSTRHPEPQSPDETAGSTLHKLALEFGLARPRPDDFKRSDSRIREDVCERLTWERGIDVSEVTVAVTDGMVVLEGTVPQRQMRYRIEDLSAACRGVKDVDNRIRVASMQAPPPGAGIV